MRMLLPQTSFVLVSFRRGLSSMALQLQTTTAEVNITSYLDDVETHVRLQGPIMTRRLSEPNRKPMIRALLGISNKREFDSVVRNAKREIEYKKLETFARDILSPALARDNNRLDKVPDMPDKIAHALALPPSSGVAAFRRLGTGRLYRGNTLEMVQDVAPEILPEYLDATQEPTDMEVLASVIQSRKSTVCSDRIDAAMRCLDEFPTRDDSPITDCDQEQDEGSIICSRSNGKDCERSCIEYLSSRLAKDEILVPNVYVNHKSALSRPKYHKTNSDRSNCVNDGIIWTSLERANSCSEFDALVYTTIDGEDVAQIEEIWEAKLSISPSTLWDAVTKKACAVRDIMQDDEAYLSHEGRYMRITSVFGSSTSGDEKLVFGIYGKDLLSPQNAVGQMISMAAANALGNDVDTIMTAIENGYVKVMREKALNTLDVLRKRLCETERDFHISLHAG